MNKRAFTTVELIFAISVAGIMLVGLLTAVTFNVKSATYNKAKLGALAILNKEMEKIRAMKYSDVGIISSDPSGTLQESDNYSFNNINYNVSRSVSWVDSDKDGSGASDADGNSNDFKQVKVSVFWSVNQRNFSVNSLTYIYGY